MLKISGQLRRVERLEKPSDTSIQLGGLLALCFLLWCGVAVAQPAATHPTQSSSTTDHVRARDLGIPFRGVPGQLNAITDVAGVEVGHTTLIRGEGPLRVGEGPVRTGVTAILPRGRASLDPVFAAWFALNGNGEMTGTTWVDESGELAGPIMITNTHSVGVVRDAVVQWLVERQPEVLWRLPVVAETFDGVLNDLNGFHVTPEHAHAALESARGGTVKEGAVGGGTGMICHGFKGGIGTASREVSLTGTESQTYTVGVLVQCNYGLQDQLTLGGIPLGRKLAEQGITGRCVEGATAPSRDWLRGLPFCDQSLENANVGDQGHRPVDPRADQELGSIIIVVATDAPLLPHQLERVVRRASLGIARMGSVAGNGSGDIFIAFSTGNGPLATSGFAQPVAVQMLPNATLSPLFAATVDATEEAVANALVAAQTMVGADDIKVLRLPHDALSKLFAADG